ncbi:hypothetical protein DBIPINDM_005430 [Mesorhizobium sp. AR02]|uniref:hypothetical protein n=1 Tax=Mesorhizobium sp. AR02 TaxID=2865837 RepID=UPI00215F3D4F|nr:hypothetical protein [Mesorhizobium sp. AR02]UVK52090.1 hypothetical protein DBIPINDM_005430 [Mesorhizobium sp. AR02]
MNTNIIPFRARPVTRSASTTRPSVGTTRGLAGKAGFTMPPTRLVCVWRRGSVSGRLECRWTQERQPVSEEGVSRRPALPRLAA